jgi:hypothetical protein
VAAFKKFLLSRRGRLLSTAPDGLHAPVGPTDGTEG